MVVLIVLLAVVVLVVEALLVLLAVVVLVVEALLVLSAMVILVVKELLASVDGLGVSWEGVTDVVTLLKGILIYDEEV